MNRNEAKVGTRVKTLTDFSGVPAGTEGVIDEDYFTGVMVAWDLPDSPLHPLYLKCRHSCFYELVSERQAPNSTTPLSPNEISEIMGEVNLKAAAHNFPLGKPLRDGFSHDEVERFLEKVETSPRSTYVDVARWIIGKEIKGVEGIWEDHVEQGFRILFTDGTVLSLTVEDDDVPYISVDKE